MSVRIAALLVVLAAAACHKEEAAAPAASGGLRIEKAAAGEVAALVARAIEREAEARRRVVVYVGAEWCGPCVAFHEAAARGELDRALAGVTMIEFDLDVDEARLAAAGYASKLVPLFALPRIDGTASGVQIEGARKDADYVAELAPRLRQLLGAK